MRGGYSETEENGTGGSRDLSENRKHGAPHSHNCVQGREVIYHQDSPVVKVTLSSTGRQARSHTTARGRKVAL